MLTGVREVRAFSGAAGGIRTLVETLATSYSTLELQQQLVVQSGFEPASHAYQARALPTELQDH